MTCYGHAACCSMEARCHLSSCHIMHMCIACHVMSSRRVILPPKHLHSAHLLLPSSHPQPHFPHPSIPPTNTCSHPHPHPSHSINIDAHSPCDISWCMMHVHCMMYRAYTHVHHHHTPHQHMTHIHYTHNMSCHHMMSYAHASCVSPNNGASHM